jgi:hypothetical protein
VTTVGSLPDKGLAPVRTSIVDAGVAPQSQEGIGMTHFRVDTAHAIHDTRLSPQGRFLLYNSGSRAPAPPHPQRFQAPRREVGQLTRWRKRDPATV